MKIKILNSLKPNNFFLLKNFNPEKEVYAKFDIGRKTYFIIDSGDYLFDCLRADDKNIKIIDYTIPKDWIFLKQFKDDYTDPYEAVIKLKNLYCPRWMIDDKEFLFCAFMDRKKARYKFIKINKLDSKERTNYDRIRSII